MKVLAIFVLAIAALTSVVAGGPAQDHGKCLGKFLKAQEGFYNLLTIGKFTIHPKPEDGTDCKATCASVSKEIHLLVTDDGESYCCCTKDKSVPSWMF